ncbi:MAG: PAS domain S-box protein, partial [Candidatus Zixiibacteriota bacterium]
FGYTLEECQADDFNFRQLLAPESLPIIEDRLRRFKAGEQLEPVYEFVAVAKDGTKIDCEVSTSYIDYKGGKATQGILRDISDRKRIREQLEEERRILRTLIDNLPDTVYIKDAQSRFIAGNKTVARKMGAASPEELIGKTDYDFYDKVYADEYFADEQEIIRTGVPLINKEETNFDARTGNKRWLLTTKVPLFDKDGNPTAIIGVGHDITDRKLAEEQLRQSKNRYRAIFESKGTATLIVAEDNTIQLANAEVYNTTGYRPEELMGTPWMNYVAPDSLRTMQEYHIKRRQSPQDAPERYAVKLIHKDGSEREALLFVNLIPDTDMSVVSILDITE